jgi:hypothetical protein
MTRVTTKAAPMPSAMPVIVSTNPCRRNSRRTSPVCAPSAMRIPISRVRCVAMYAITPSGRAINPITKTNWEGVGIEPHVKVAARLALKSAHLDALRKLRAAADDEARQEQLDRDIEDIQKDLDALSASPKTSANKQISDTPDDDWPQTHLLSRDP